MKSVMQHKFSEVPQVEVPRSSFNRSHGYKTTFDAGYLIPFLADEVLPGDTFNVNATLFARLATPIVPLMDNLYMDTFYFFVPLRLVWSDFQKFMGEQVDPGDSTDFTVPQVTSPAVTGFVVGTLFDYLGLPTGVTNLSVSALYSRAYNLIWNEWFRDQNLQDSVVVDKDAGADSPTDYVLLRRGKRHDYFTSALPLPQKGQAIDMPLGISADIKWGESIVGADLEGKWLVGGNDSGTIAKWAYGNTADTLTANLAASDRSNLVADLTTATAATINSLRESFQLQRMLEKDARGGTRYVEMIKSHFGVTSPDARLQRPEYLGGASSPVVISSVPQTSETTATSPQGNLAAYGTVASQRNGFTKSFTEHGVLLGIVSVRADLTYQQGIPRQFSRSTRYDFYFPSLAHLGEQEVLNKEIYAQGTADDSLVFGYQERFAEYRYFPSQITGKMRSTYATSLDVWHLSQEFSSLPTLSDTFIVENPPMARVIAVNTEPHFIFDSFIDCKCARCMPTYSVPGLIDHF